LPRRGRIALLSLFAVLAVSLTAGPAASAAPRSGTVVTAVQAKTELAKTKFVLHAGLAFGAFHRYIYKPFKKGGLHGFGLVKAGLAGVFAYHEIKLALYDAQSSPLLKRLVSPLTALSAGLLALGNKLKGGRTDGKAIDSTNSQVSAAGAAARAAGQSVTDVIPTAKQLAAG